MRNLKSTIGRPAISALLVLLMFAVSSQAQDIPVRQKPSAKSSKDYLNLLKETNNTISFIENKGQFAPEVRMVGSTNVGNMWVLNNQIYFQSLHKEKDEAAANASRSASEIGEEEEGKIEAHNWGIFMEGMNPEFTVSKELEMPTKRSYFLGNDKKYWASDVASYGEISLDNIYKGVDLRLYSQDKRHLEFDWLVEPGADYSQIRMRFKGQEALRVDEKGNLDVQLEFDHIKFDIPEAYQVVDGKKVPVQISFVVKNNVATFSTKEKIDNRYPLVIDPSLKWGTWFDNGTNLFDQYLYAVDVDGSGNVYCGGTTNCSFSRGYTGNSTVYGFDSTYNDAVNGATSNGNTGYSDGIVYKISANGTTLMNITYFGSTSPASGTRTTYDEVYGLSLSPDFSTVYICGRTGNTGTAANNNNTDIPLVGSWDNTRNSNTREGYVAKFNSSLTSLQYSTYIGGAGGSSDAMYSIHALGNSSFVVGGDVDGAVQTSSPNYIVNAYDATYDGGDEIYIAKFSPDNAIVFGTYVGGQNNDHLNDINPFSDGAICFTGRTNSSLASFPGGATGINRASSNGGDNNQDGVVGVIPSNGGTFTMLSRIGGSGNDEFNGFAIDPFDTIYISGTTSNNNFPLGTGASAANRLDNSYNGGTDGIIAKIPRSGFTGGTDPWAATYFGGGGTDIANTLRLYTPYALASFGTTTSAAGTIANNGFPVQNLVDGGTFYQASLVNGIDMYWLVLGTDLKTQYFTTYVGGSDNDYLGATGVPRGSNQFVTEGDSLIILGTTSHSSNTNPNNTGFSPTILGPTTGALKSFQPFTTDADNDDKHIIFKWRIGVLLNFDYGDAPSTLGYGAPNHIVFQSLKLGSLLDKEDLPQYSYKADGDDNLTSDDEDGITTSTVTIQDTSTRFSKVINVTNNTGITAILAGWIDFNKSGGFGDVANEVDTVLVPPGATTVTLTWSGYNASAAYFNMPNDTTYMRLRLTTQSNFFVTNPSPTLNAANGEIEDYLVIRYHCVNLSSAIIDTNGTSSCGSATGSIVITNDTIYAGVQYGVYYSKDGGPLQGPFFYTTTGSGISGTLTISGLTAGTYTAVQVFHPTNPACGFTLPGSYVILDPTPPSKPGITAPVNQVCLNGSFTLTATGSGTFNWTGPNGFSANTASFTRNPATALMTGSYCVHRTVASCVSADSCITFTVNPLPSLTASSNTPVCTGSSSTINLTSTPSAGTSPYTTYVWSGVGGFSASTQNATNGPPVTTGMAGAYNVTVTDSKGCTASATTSVAVNTSPSVSPTSNGPICSGLGKTLSLTANPVGTISTYSWSGPASFNSAVQNPTRVNTLPTYSGAYTVNVTATNGCSATGNVSVIVNESPVATPSSNSPVCANAILSFDANPSLGTTPYTFTWSGSGTLTNGTTQTPFVSNAQTSATGTYSVTVTAGNTCTAVGSVSATVNPNPVASPSSNTPICQNSQLNLLTNPSGGSGVFTTYSWSGPSFASAIQNPSITNAQPVANSGTYNVTVTDNRGCIGTGSTNVTVNSNPTLIASSNSAVCAPNALNLTSTPSGGSGIYSTYNWSGPSGYSSASQNPIRTPSTTLMSGAYNVTVTDNRGCTATATTSVTVNATLVATTGSNTPVCSGGTLNLTSTPNGASTYLWSGPGGYTSNLQNPSRSSAVSGFAGNYSVIVTDANGCSGSASSLVVVNQGVSVAPSSNTPVCETLSLNLSANPTGGTTPYGFTWSGPVAFGSTSQNPTRSGMTLAMAGTYTVIISDVNGCSASGQTVVSVTAKPGIETASALPNPICTGFTLGLNVTGSGGTWGWNGPNSFTSSSQNPSIASVTLAAGGTYKVAHTVSGCTSDSSSVTVVVNQTPGTPTAGASPNPICSGNTLSLTATGVGTSWSWSGPNLFTSTLQNPTISGITTTGTGTYSVFQTINGCTSVAAGTVAVTVNQTPTAPSLSSNNPSCYGDTLKLFAATVPGATYSWTGPGGFTSALQNPVRPNATPVMNGTYTLDVTVLGCTSATPSTVLVSSIVSCPPVAVNDNYSTNEDVTLNIPATGILANDFDNSNPAQPITLNTTPISNPSHGSVAINSNGSFTYIPNANYNGNDTFSYSICDNELPTACDTAIVVITVIPVNDPPLIRDSTITTPEDNPITVCLPITDPETGIQSHLLSAIYCGPANGTITSSVVSNGSNPHTVCLTYSPSLNFNGNDSVCIVVCDNGTPQLCDTAVVRITVTPVNDKPVAVDDYYVSCTDTAVKKNFMLNDGDVDGPALQYNGIVFGPSFGTITVGPSIGGNFTFTPTVSFNGLDSFAYVICDLGSPNLCDTAVVVLDYSCVNVPPIALNDNFTINEDQTLNNTVATNDVDPDGGILTYNTSPVVNVTNGSLTLNSNGTFTYIPNANYFGSDSFVYSVCDNGVPVKCATATAYITILPVNDPPVVRDSTVTTPEDIPYTVCLPISDIESFDLHLVAVNCLPSNGILSALNVNNLGNPHEVCITYTPNLNYNGTDSFCLLVCDNGSPSRCDTAIIHINVTPVNDPPIAVNDSYNTNEDNPVITNSVSGVRNNDNDNADGNSVTTLSVSITPVLDVTHGTLSLSSDGSFIYTPTPNYCGNDSFQYRICDSGTGLPANLCDTATAYISIACVNDPPVVIDTPITQCEDCGPITVCIPVTDLDAGQQHFIAATFCGPNNGGVSSTLNGPLFNSLCVTYTPNSNFNGNDSICIIVCDNGTPVLCDTTHITITVTPVNDPPIALNDTYNTNEDNSVITNSITGVRNNDNDNADGNSVTTLTVSAAPVVDVAHGTLSLSSDGSFVYTPTSNYCGNDSFQYRICDSGTGLPANLCDTATAYISIACVNDPPVVRDTTATTPEDTPITVCVPISDNDAADVHAFSLCGNAVNGASTVSLSNGTLPHTICVAYTPFSNFYGIDSICIIICDNGLPQGCDTSHVYVNVTPVNDRPWADTIYVYTYQDQPVGVNVSGASGDPDGNPLTYTYGSPSPNNGVVIVSGNGSVDVTPNSGFTGTFTIPYQVCDLSPYNVNILCANAAIVVTVLPPSDTVNNHAPVANNDFATTPVNTAIVVNVLNNDFDPDGDNPLSVTVTTLPNHGTVSVNPNGTINYNPATGFSGYDTLTYTLCDPAGSTLPRPLCDQATVIISINQDPIVTVNDPPVAADDFAEICTNANVIFRLLQNDYDQNGNAITSCSIIKNVVNGVLSNPGFGLYIYGPNSAFAGYDTVLYRICDNGTPSLCDTGMAVIHVLPNPTLTPNVASITNCSNDSVNILVTSDVPGTTITWTATNGTSGTGDVHTVLANSGTANLSVVYTFTGVSSGGCGSSSVLVPVTVRPRPIATAFVNTSLVCSGENVLINALSNIGGTTFAWFGSDGTNGNGNTISVNPVNNGTSTIVVNYVIIPSYNGCTGDSLVVAISVKPRPVLSLNPSAQTVCSGTPISVGISTSVPGTNVTWVATDGNSGNTFTINDSPVNITSSNIVVTYTVNGSFNGCNANTVFGTVTVRPRVVADAGSDKTVTACSGSCVQIGGSPTGVGGSGTLTYSWTPTSGLSSATTANPTACGILTNTSFVVAVTDAFGCSASDAMNISSSPSSLTAEAGAGGAFCLATGDSVMLGGFPTAVGGVPAYTYTWAPAGLNLTNPANPWAFPSATTKYFLTVTDALGCTSIDSTIVTAYPQLFANAGTDTIVCAGFPANLGGNPTALAGSGNGFTYAWSPTNNVSNTAVSNPTASPVVTTSYVVTVTDGNGCHASDTIKIVVRATPLAQAGPDKTIAACPGDSIILGDNPAVIGGVPGYTYSWSPSTGIINSTNIANPVVKNLVSAQTYSLVVTDANGCTSSDNITINVSPNNLSANAGNDKFICYGNSVQLGALPLVVGGSPPYVYTWMGGALNDSTASNPVANPISNTTYTVNVIDAKGCTASDIVLVAVNAELISNAGPDTSVCSGGGVVIGGSSSASGGTPGYTFTWTPSLGLSSPGVGNPTASPNLVTTYQLIVLDSKGCSSLDEVTVTPRTNPIADAGNDKTLVGCAGDSTFIGGLPTVIGGGTPPYSCVWSPAFGLSDSNTCNPTVQGLQIGAHSYQLLVKDTYGCTGVDYVIVNITPSTLQVDAGNNGTLCSNAGVSITIGGVPTAVGGTAPYTYTWSSSQVGFTSDLSNPSVSPTVTTTYYVTVLDSKGCVSTDSVVITVNEAPIARAGNDTAVCSGFCVLLGSANTATGGSSPYQYSWTPTLGLNANNTGNPLACPIITTTYSVIVTDANGCRNTDNITVSVRPIPSAFAGTDQNLTTCGGDSVQIGGSPAANGGVLPYSYAWSPASGLSGTAIANPFVKGIVSSQVYTLIVTDFNGCTAEDAVSITVVPSTLAADAGNDASYCSGAGSSVTLGAGNTGSGGSPSYTFAWASNPSGFTSSVAHPVVSPLVTTTYLVTVSDSKGCIAVDSVKVTVKPSPVANAGRDTTLCKGKTVILGGQTTASGNFGPFTYSWSPSTGLSDVAASNPTATAISTISYSVIVTDANGCTANDVVQLNVNDNPIADAGLDKSLVSCASDSVKLGGSPSASGGGGTYTYTWSPAPQLNNSTVANPFASHLGSTTIFSLVVTDQFGCSAQDQVSVNVNQPTFIVNAGNDVSFCQGTSVSVTLGSPAVGGTLPYTYSWTPGSSLVNGDSTRYDPVAIPTVTTTYTVAVKDAAGCFASDTVKITINPRPVVNAGVSDTICAGECLSLGGSPTASSGTGPITYLWTPSQFINGSVTSSNPIACPTATITYQVTATDSLGCSNNASIFIRVNQNPVAFAGTDKSLVDCNNSCIAIGGSPSANGGGGGYLYAWSPATGLNNTGLANPSVCNLAQGVHYTLTVTDANGCTAVDQVNVALIASTLHADAGADKSICVNPLVSNCISIGGANAVTGASGSYVIDWSPVSGICNFNNIPNPEVSPTTTTTYTLSVTDSLGCVAIDSVIVFANPPVTVTVGNDTAICAGGSAVLGGNPTGSAGTGSITYTWNPGTGLSNSTVANPVASPTASTSYCVTVTDAVGCSSSTCQSITVNQAIVANAGLDQAMTNCPGAFVIIGGSPAGTGGSNNYTYSWSPAVIDGVSVLNGTSIPNPVVTGLTRDTVFTLTVTDFITGCSGTDQVKITVNQTTLAADAGLDRTLCANSGSCVTIGGNPTAAGGVFPYIYQWSPITGLSSGNIANPCASPASTTTYRVTVTDQVGCSFVDSVKVIVSPLIIVDAGNDIAICYGTSTTLGGNPVATGGTGAYTYQWSPGTSIIPANSANPVANPTTNSSYTLIVTDALGCSSSDAINISVRSLPIANAGPDAAITACSGDSAILGGTPTATGTVAPYTYLWSPPTALSDITVANPVVKQLGFITQFCVLVTDSFGCQASSCQTTAVLPNTIFVDAGTNISSLCSNVGGCVTLGGTVGRGYPQYTYQWYNGVNDPTVFHPQVCPTATTTYLLVVTDTRGCQASDSVKVIVNQPAEVSISGLNSQYCIGSGNVVMTGIPAGGTFSGPFVTGNVFQPTAVGNWCIKYTYTSPATGCTDDTTICVTVNPLPVVSASGFNPSYCHFEAPFTITGTPAGGVFSGSSGVSSSGVFTPTNATVGNNNITYTYTDPQTQCSNTFSFVINIKDAPTLNISSSVDTACAGQTVTLSANVSLDVFNVRWFHLNGALFNSTLAPFGYIPTGFNDVVVAQAVNTPGNCFTYDTLTIHVNQSPVALNDSATTLEEVPVSISELVNDSDPEGNTNSVTVLSVGHGTATNGNGVINYVSNANYNGLDTIVYKICNTNCPNACDTAIIAITVTPVNDPPVISDTTVTINENDTADVCPFIFDVDGDALVIGNAQCAPLNGTIVFTSDSCFEFIPATGWTGTQVICITVCDPSGLCDTGRITIHVLPINHRPRTSRVSVTVCENTSIGINVSAGVADPEGSPLSFTYGNATKPNNNATYALTVTGNGAVVFSADTAGNYLIPYIVCDNSNPSLCDTNQIIVTVIHCDSSNTAPVSNNDEVETCPSTNLIINELANDFDADYDSLAVSQILTQPTLAGAVVSVNNTTGTINYTSPTAGFDSIEYVVCDTHGACDTAIVYIKVSDTCVANHPPLAVDDFDSTNFNTPIIVHVLSNDHDPDGNGITLISIPCSPSYGSAVITNGIVLYIPDTTFNANMTDTFCYVIRDSKGALDTAVVVIYVRNSVQGRADCGNNITGVDNPIDINVLANDFDPEGHTFSITTLISTQGVTHGVVSLNENGTIHFVPDTTICGITDQFQYVIQDALGATDTVAVCVQIDCCRKPVANTDTATIIGGDSLTINVILNDVNTSGLLTAGILVNALHGNASISAGILHYVPASTYCGFDTIQYTASSHCGIDTGLVIVNVNCNQKPVAADDNLTICLSDTASMDVLVNDKDPDGNVLTLTGLSNPFPANLAVITAVDGGSISFQSNGSQGTFTLNYYVCDNGLPSRCDTGKLTVKVVPCIVHIDTLYDTTYVNTPDTICLGGLIQGTNRPTLTSLCPPLNGTVDILPGDTCFVYTPNTGYIGNDTFCIVVCDTLGHCDTSGVIITVLDKLIQAIDEPCDLDTAYMNEPKTLDVLANDILPLAGDTAIALLRNPVNGTAIVNANNTITYTPVKDFKGDEKFSYIVCAVTGTRSFCDTAEICITVVDTTVECFIPNGFSPNGDGVNDLYKIPCNGHFPKATIRIFDRWGVEVWFSEGAYMNDFAGKNMQGSPLPDSTYYMIYEYNDGSGKREAKFIVINR